MIKLKLLLKSLQHGKIGQKMAISAASDDYLTDNNLSNLLIVKVIVDHLNSLHAHFRNYFPTDIDLVKESWIRELFISKLLDVTHLSLKVRNSLQIYQATKVWNFYFQHRLYVIFG